MPQLNWYNLCFKLIIFLSFINLFNCDVCTIQATCQCQLKNINLTETAQNNQIQLIQNSINVCQSPPQPPPNKTDRVNSSNYKYEMTCISLINLNDTHTELNNPTQFTVHDNDTETFTVMIKYPCQIPTPPKKPKGYSTGSILDIIFFTISFAYLGLGISVNYFLVGARGVEMIPNLDFWKDFPALVLDGMKFIQNGCTARPSDLSAPSGAEGYDAI